MTLGDRMKMYECVPKNRLIRRMPVIIRIDGCHFHTFTRGFDKPFDDIFMNAMIHTTEELCANIQGCVLGYTQSDEISLVLCDYKKLDTAAWFDNQVQKICSVSASMAAMIFNRDFEKRVRELMACEEQRDGSRQALNAYEKYRYALSSGAVFDARCFNLPKEEVCNYIIWRQQDAERNSILGLAQSLFSHKELHGMSCNGLQDKMFSEKGVNWSEMHSHKKRGVVIARPENTSAFVAYPLTPQFKESRDFVESRIVFPEE